MKSKWKVSIEKITETINTRVFEVVVSDDGKKHLFRVEVDKDYSNILFGKEIPNLLLVQQSFIFLLEHEPVTSILRDFNLKEIQSYFGDYEETMKKFFLS